jgi:hypothetical protein
MDTWRDSPSALACTAVGAIATAAALRVALGDPLQPYDLLRELAAARMAMHGEYLVDAVEWDTAVWYPSASAWLIGGLSRVTEIHIERYYSAWSILQPALLVGGMAVVSRRMIDERAAPIACALLIGLPGWWSASLAIPLPFYLSLALSFPLGFAATWAPHAMGRALLLGSLLGLVAWVHPFAPAVAASAAAAELLRQAIRTPACSSAETASAARAEGFAAFVAFSTAFLLLLGWWAVTHHHGAVLNPAPHHYLDPTIRTTARMWFGIPVLTLFLLSIGAHVLWSRREAGSVVLPTMLAICAFGTATGWARLQHPEWAFVPNVYNPHRFQLFGTLAVIPVVAAGLAHLLDGATVRVRGVDAHWLLLGIGCVWGGMNLPTTMRDELVPAHCGSEPDRLAFFDQVARTTPVDGLVLTSDRLGSYVAACAGRRVLVSLRPELSSPFEDRDQRLQRMRALRRASTPEVFASVAPGPRVASIVITPDFDAAIVRHPQSGFREVPVALATHRLFVRTSPARVP